MKVTVRPGHSTALARRLWRSRLTENFGESKYFGSGMKWRRVPVLRLPTESTTARSVAFSPSAKVIR